MDELKERAYCIPIGDDCPGARGTTCGKAVTHRVYNKFKQPVGEYCGPCAQAKVHQINVAREVRVSGARSK